jgi:hypothetical protein
VNNGSLAVALARNPEGPVRLPRPHGHLLPTAWGSGSAVTSKDPLEGGQLVLEILDRQGVVTVALQ